MRLGIRTALVSCICLGTMAPTFGEERTWLPVSPRKLPPWHGFNLLEKFHKDWSNGPFLEDDFRMISELGFNFVRLPMDYRVWIVDGDPRQFDENVLRDIDRAVEFGEKYGIHVCINFHRAPGYTVASPKEPTDLWTDGETQEICALHWRTFAARYKDVPSERLSFNLFNEPADIDGRTYRKVAGIMVDAIRAEDPNRLIIADGLPWAGRPCTELFDLGIAQATRGYTPFIISHYKAEWVGNASGAGIPAWPRPRVAGWLAAGEKKDQATPIVLEGPFPDGTGIRFRVTGVSAKARFVVKADAVELINREFAPGAGKGEWVESVFMPQWDIYHARYDLDVKAEIPPGTRRILAEMTDGDWMTLSEVALSIPGKAEEERLPLLAEYGATGKPVAYRPQDPDGPFVAEEAEDENWLWQETILPWRVAREANVGVMVGEFGAYRYTPHDVVLRWMEDCLQNWERAGWGWALWNFRGSFGVLDSGREDVAYEEFRGHKLDRKMLDLLLKYR